MQINWFYAAAERLRSVFGEDATVYEGAAPQSAARPCFVAEILSVTAKAAGAVRVRTTAEITVSYLPAPEYEGGTLCEAARRMTEALSSLTIAGQPVLSFAKRYEVRDGTAKAFGSYQLFLQLAPAAEQMDDIQVSTETRG